MNLDDIIRAEWHLLIVLNFNIDFRTSSPFFWAANFLQFTCLGSNIGEVLSAHNTKLSKTN